MRRAGVPVACSPPSTRIKLLSSLFGRPSLVFVDACEDLFFPVRASLFTPAYAFAIFATFCEKSYTRFAGEHGIHGDKRPLYIHVKTLLCAVPFSRPFAHFVVKIYFPRNLSKNGKKIAPRACLHPWSQSPDACWSPGRLMDKIHLYGSTRQAFFFQRLG